MRRAYANLAYNATTSQPTSGEAPTLEAQIVVGCLWNPLAHAPGTLLPWQ